MSQQRETNKKQKTLALNPGSERSLLSICIQRPDKIIDVIDEDITVDHFGIEANRYIFMAIMYLYHKGLKPTPMAILEVTSTDTAKKAIEEIGGIEHLMLLEEVNVSEDNIKIFIDKVKQAYTRRKLYEIADSIKELVISEKAEILNPTELTSEVQNKITDLVVDTTKNSEIYKMGQSTDEVLRLRADNPTTVAGIEVGWEKYDEYTGGAQGGDLVVVCAPSKTGKSVTLTNWATHIAVKSKMPVLYFDTEMNEREQEDRILSNLSGVPEHEIINGMYTIDTAFGNAKDKIEKIIKAKDLLNSSEFYHIFVPQFTIEKITAIAKKYVIQHGVKAIFFDYIKIPSSQASFRQVQEYQQLGYLTSGLKEMAGILNVPVFTACQTNRDDLEGSNPDAGNIGGSYRILQLASKLVFLYNKPDAQIAKDGHLLGNQQLFIKYQRHGSSDCPPINIMFEKHILRQYEV